MEAQLKDAHQQYDQLSYQSAIRKYKRILKRKPDNGDALFNLANSYRLNGEPSKARFWFSKAVQHDGRPEATLYYAQVLLTMGEYGRAQEQFTRYAGLAGNSRDAQISKKIAAQCEEIEQNGIEKGQYAVTAVSFNSEELDFSPCYFGEKKIVFASNRKGSRGKVGERDPWTEDEFVDIFSVDFDGKNGFGDPAPLFGKVNSRYHEGPMTFTRDGSRMFYTRSDFHKRRGFDELKNTRLKIYEAEWIEGKWRTKGEMPFNDSKYSTAHPALSADGKVLIFASDRPGGFGGMDLYVSEARGRGWSEPENLGQTINTSGNEVFPFLSKEGDLYFSSDLHVGFGGLDIFRSSVTGTFWDVPENMGAPINGPRDDFGIVLEEGGERGFFSSNRARRDDDIYMFELIEEDVVRGKVVDCQTREPIGGADVTVDGFGFQRLDLVTDEEGLFEFHAPRGMELTAEAKKENYVVNEACPGKETFSHDGTELELALPIVAAGKPSTQRVIRGQVVNADYGTPLTNARISLINKCTGEIYETHSDGKGYFEAPAALDCDYILRANKPNFKPLAHLVSTFDLPKDLPVEHDLPLEFDALILDSLTHGTAVLNEGTVIELEHIYFDFDMYDIRPDAIPELKALLTLLVEHPEMKGELAAHTDSRASYDYNIELSQNRAESVVRWLEQRGISPDRIKAKGYGETVLRNGCADGVDCDEFQHQRNRRVEFRVTSLKRGSIVSKEAIQYHNR